MRQKLVAGNWKMFGCRASVEQLLLDLAAQEYPANVGIAVFPGFLHLQQVKQSVLSEKGWNIGAQDCATEQELGAFTGEVSAKQLADVNCSMVLVGHSERRILQFESDQVICRKFIAAQSAGLTPILCLGESLAEREAGKAEETVLSQLNAVLQEVGIGAFEHAVIAYEPVWAIGTGLTATPEQAQEIHRIIREYLKQHDQQIGQKVQILYGGSVKAANAAELFAMADIDGGLVGGASLNAEEFSAICRAAGN